MAKRKAKENLRSFSIIYLILAALYLIATILCIAIPDITNIFRENWGDNAAITLGSVGGITILFNLWYFWLARRVADGKSSGVFYMILLLLGVASSIVTAITSHSLIAFTSIDFIVDALGLYFVVKVMQEKK